MAILGTLLKNKRAGEAQLAWNLPQLTGRETIDLSSHDFAHGGDIPQRHAGRRAGGENLSPALSWTGVPADAEQLLLVVEDVDSPTRAPFVHCLALLAPTIDGIPAGALNAGAAESASGASGGTGRAATSAASAESTMSAADGVRVLRWGMRRGYLGPEPIKGHGPHRYVFQLFALGAPVATGSGDAPLETAKPRALLAAVTGPVLARGRLDGSYER
ncbi:YbhB/YbcL family Raf kinase inhibitor-like protein [Streptacidiphilus sp. MAP5-3]|uniref:YbhB/YbcL family Raf kinase inhibitor-like protein n=1 Tax=unclassified Streptacidiphilus TaxID=2643834 RepID=UPI003515A5AA